MELSELSDGTSVTFQALRLEDAEKLKRFFQGLSPEDRRYLRYDVTREGVVKRLLDDVASGRVYRAAAMVDGEVAGYCAIEHDADSWQSHIGEIRVIVAEGYRRKRLGTLLIGHLVRRAEKQAIERLLMKLAGPQLHLRGALEQFGFNIDAVLEGQVKTLDGKVHPLVVMSCPLSEMAQSLRKFYRHGDWPDG